MSNFGIVDFVGTIAVAVSGGSDSMALLHVAARWARERKAKIVAIHVNHQLRDDASIDASHVSQYCKQQHIECFILNWQHSQIASNIQHQARDARYLMMSNLCKDIFVSHLLTAHHADDNAENFAIRLIKGSGLIGLAASYEYFHNNIRILRPFYNISKDDCTQYLTLNKLSWVEDSSNSSAKYLRNDIRINIQGILQKQHINYSQLIARINDVSANFSDVSDIVKKRLIELLALYCIIEKTGHVLINYLALKNENNYIKILLISYLVTIVSGRNFTPRSNKIAHLLKNIDSSANRQCTIHSCKIIRQGDMLLIMYESELNKTDKSVILKNHLLWNNRFLIKVKDDVTEKYVVDFCSRQDYINIKDELNLRGELRNCLNKFHDILFTLPIIKLNDKIVAIVQINYYDISARQLSKSVEIDFAPSFKSKLIHY